MRIGIKFFLLLAGIMLVVFPRILAGTDHLNIIPKPDQVNLQTGVFDLTPETVIVAAKDNAEIDGIADYLQERILRPTGIKLAFGSGTAVSKTIRLILDSSLSGGKGGYRLVVQTDRIEIKAKEPLGIFYGIQTLCQLFPPEFESRLILKYPKWKIPCLTIKDEPRFSYRGLHLDVGRHFFPVSFIKRYIDLIAKYKLNTFHWHLTEDQGWRIEIKKYPKLTEIGAYRNETLVGHGSGEGIYDGRSTGGFYTQAEIKEVVAYAQSRFVTIIPEIEMPGHSSAALAAYPELGCKKGPYSVATRWGVFTSVYCAGREETFEFLEDVLSEVIELFPGKYVHIGGDECPKDAWKKCKKCRQRIKKENLRDEHELQSYFIKRIEKFLLSKGKKLIGWDEILEGGLAPQATVMSWRGIQGGLAAARAGHDVIMTPNKNCYFDHYQASPEFEPLGIGGYLTLKKMYQYEPVPKELQKKYYSHIIGAQGNVWTEYMPISDHVEYMVLPRLCALAEVLWTNPEQKDWQDFSRRIQYHFKRFDFGGYEYSRGTYKIDMSVEFDHKNKNAKVKLESEQYRPVIRYTIDGTLPDCHSKIYNRPFKIEKLTKIKAGIFKNGRLIRGLTEKIIGIHKGVGKKIRLANEFSYKYKAGGESAVIDGITGSKLFDDGFWQGFEGVDFNGTIDLGNNITVSGIKTRFYHRPKSWIFLPSEVAFYGSKDGTTYSLLKKFRNKLSLNPEDPVVREFEWRGSNGRFSYIRVAAKNIGICPQGHPGEGGKAWLFLDEIIIE